MLLLAKAPLDQHPTLLSQPTSIMSIHQLLLGVLRQGSASMNGLAAIHQSMPSGMCPTEHLQQPQPLHPPLEVQGGLNRSLLCPL